MVTRTLCLEPATLELFLERRFRSGPTGAGDTSLAAHLVEILERSNEFVPSQAGSILLDDPTEATDAPERSLTFIAAFGEKAKELIGRRIPAREGIAGFVYRTGKSYVSSNAHQDSLFFREIDETTSFRTHSLIAIPVRLRGQVCGVLELLRTEAFSADERELLEVFADHISFNIQIALDARRAERLARQDTLTQLYNDRHLHVALDDAIQNVRKPGADLSVIFLDLDRFKSVNDTHGHLAGSQVLREVGEVIRARLEGLDFAARYGGDEFVVVLPRRDLPAAEALAEALRHAIRQTRFCPRGGDIHPEPLGLEGLTASLGVASLGTARQRWTADPKTNLLQRADDAMYKAKAAGRNRTEVAPPAEPPGPPPPTPSGSRADGGSGATPAQASGRGRPH